MKFKVGEKIIATRYDGKIRGAINNRWFHIYIPFLGYYSKTVRISKKFTFLRKFHIGKNYINEYYNIITENGDNIYTTSDFIEKIDKKVEKLREKRKEELRLKYIDIDPLGEEIWEEEID